jgi:hypothetical protein
MMAGVLVGVAGASHAAPPALVAYEGQLLDAHRKPLSGIYPLTFSLYRSEKSTRPAWSEAHFVAVQDGKYAVHLGDTRPIPPTLHLERLYISVGVTGGAELVREKLAVGPASAAPDVAPAVAPDLDPAAASGKARAAGDSYAEIAGFAYEADRAHTADAVGGLTAAELRKMVKESKSEITIGTRTRNSEAAGGTGGQPYTLRCPKGYVVTGIQGGAAAFVDSISIICSPLE